MTKADISYENFDESVSEMGSSSGATRPKWMTPNGPVQEKIVSCSGRKFYPMGKIGKAFRARAVDIEKAAQPMFFNLGKSPAMPIEWVEFVCEKVREMRRGGRMISLPGVLTWIENHDMLTTWKDKWIREHQGVSLPVVEKIYSSNR